MLVIAATGIETDHQIDITDARLQRFEICRQIVAATFFAGFDKPNDARMFDALLFKG